MFNKKNTKSTRGIYKISIFKKILARLSLQKILTIPFIFLICITVTIVATLSLHNGQKAVNDIGNNLIDEISTQIILKLNNYLKPLHLANSLNANAVSLNYINLQNKQNIEKHFWHQIQNFPSPSFIYWGNDSVKFYGSAHRYGAHVLEASAALTP